MEVPKGPRRKLSGGTKSVHGMSDGEAGLSPSGHMVKAQRISQGHFLVRAPKRAWTMPLPPDVTAYLKLAADRVT